MSTSSTSNAVGTATLYNEYGAYYRRTYPLRRSTYVTAPFAAARLRKRVFSHKEEYSICVRVVLDINSHYRPAGPKVDKHNVRRIRLGELSWVGQAEQTVPGVKRKRMVPVVEHLLEELKDEVERWSTFKYCTDETRAKLAQGQCLVMSIDLAGKDSIEIDNEADLSGQTLVNTLIDEDTFCDDGDKDDGLMPGGTELGWQVASERCNYVCRRRNAVYKLGNVHVYGVPQFVSCIPSASDMIASFARMCASATSSMSGVRPQAVTYLNVHRSPVVQLSEDDDHVESDANIPFHPLPFRPWTLTASPWMWITSPTPWKRLSSETLSRHRSLSST
ncbi:hypothetical protein WOLCODRAFT_166269 [Wolfiporia cocos MD-104 SS10]|uniref:Uncharacterized protein n=1 Tax=Wolfiporia cocos (strain MD-104) TaxID=742152 RepID=A0A2H3IZL6_WOLCO|nr:hypothetical protein WOLCODRAFT_166269 [Wolfiporia cocos MD-104 SS10]